MNNFDIGPFVYDDHNDNDNNSNYNNTIKKMYNRGEIMTTEECCQLNAWATKLYTNGQLDALSNDRFELKLSCDNKNVIPLVFEIKKRINEREGLSSFKCETVIKDFLAVIPTNGYIHKHTDPNDFQTNLFHVRFNVFINMPPNDVGATYYNGVTINSVKCCYVLCRSGIDEHWSDVNTSDVPRISLSFGYLLPAEKIDELTKDPSIGTYAKYHPLALQNIGRLSISLTDIPRPIEIEERGEKGSCIYTISNLLTDTKCNYITNYIERNSSLWEERSLEYGYGNNVECKFIKLKKNVPEYDIMDSFIFSSVGKIINKMVEIHDIFKSVQDDGYTLRKIFGGTRLHTDGVHSKTSGFIKFVRCLSLIIVLNDDYDGGVFCFPNQGLKFRVQKGQAILFPPYWTHPHAVTSVGEGQARYTINTWILEKFID
jgi:hypothetical protein